MAARKRKPVAPRKRVRKAEPGWKRYERERRQSKEFKRRSAAAKKGWVGRRIRYSVDTFRLEHGPLATGSFRGGWNILSQMITRGDERWQKFLKAITGMGLSEREAKSIWFSPRVPKA